MKSLSRLALCCGLLLALPLCAQAEVWRGTIGTLPIALKLDDEKGPDVYGQYFYFKHLRDLELEGKRDERGVLHLQVRSRDEEAATERWELSEKAGALEGQWTSGKRSLPIRLQRVDLKALRAGRDGERYRRAGDDVSAFDALRIGELALEKSKTQQFQGHSLQWWREPRSGAELFTVESGIEAPARARVNGLLKQRLWRTAIDALQCTSAPNSDFDLTVTPRLLDRRFLSLSLMTSYYCGGAHPDFGDSPLTIDVRSGRELALEDILWLGKGEPPRSAGNGDYESPGYKRLNEYRESTLVPWTVKTLTRLHPDEMAPPAKEDEGCNYADPGVWGTSIWYLTAEGLYLGPYFARVARACEYPDWSLVPWTLVERNPGPALQAK
ncbi:hypothetical protein J5226_10285 [Lysobacter sp. K5869]|uniref:hypothetical protein n=1 Tax=Lysobacter sp. K5869 TaxID=2820808 RepID=UPI001C063614|nr:hypothetical protein [Lysobacter sp. K5869]QWP78752.1 hypothetical protein J5226_10285 [Lysobacter sp. K5869]